MNKYRFETGTLFEYSKEHRAYIAVFTDYRYQTKASAIKAYEFCHLPLESGSYHDNHLKKC